MHTVKFGAAFANTEIDSAWHDTNYIPSTGAPITPVSRFTGAENWIEQGMDRNLINITLQDEYKLNDKISITGGLRFDHYDDVGSELSPRIAAVWRVTQNHIIKTQYARAFCPPTFNQLYSKNNPYLVGNPAIDPETIDTVELSYLYRDELTMGRVTYFYSNLDDLISSGGAHIPIPINTDIRAELEFEHKLIDRSRLTAISPIRIQETASQGAPYLKWLNAFRSGHHMNLTGIWPLPAIQLCWQRNRAVTDRRPK
jgi:iron complex outermembrane receptor protein